MKNRRPNAVSVVSTRKRISLLSTPTTGVRSAASAKNASRSAWRATGASRRPRPSSARASEPTRALMP
jgi:hypothetical protein